MDKNIDTDNIEVRRMRIQNKPKPASLKYKEVLTTVGLLVSKGVMPIEKCKW